MAKLEFLFSISGARSTTTIRTHNVFDVSYQESSKSPIDIYKNNILTYKKLLGCFILEPESGNYVSLAASG
ncbi:hypothetical protein, partial [Shewanella xiamenensis]